MKSLGCEWQAVVCLFLIPRGFVNASNICEQNPLPLSVTISVGTPNLAIKCSSVDYSTVTASLDAIGVIIRKPESRSLMVSMYLFSREAGSSPTRSMCILSNRPGLLGKLLNVLRLCRKVYRFNIWAVFSPLNDFSPHVVPVIKTFQCW